MWRERERERILIIISEWQWESWPIKQESLEQEGRSPIARLNVALWKDKTSWYLFGGKPVRNELNKIYSDVWKYTVKTRSWTRLIPSQSDNIKKKKTLLATKKTDGE